MLKKVLLASMLCGTLAAGDFFVMPEQIKGNLRNPPIAPEGRQPGAKGFTSPVVGKVFSWPVGKIFKDTSSGSLSFYHRSYLDFVHVFHSIRFLDAKNPKFAISHPHVHADKSPWTFYRFRWGKDGLFRTVGDAPETRVAERLPEHWTPDTLQLDGYAVDEVRLEVPSGTLSIDWENDVFFAKVEKTDGNGSVFSQVTGFDNFFISKDWKNRDTPALLLVNASSSPKQFLLSFDLTSELRGKAEKWTQSVSVPAGSSVFEFVKFPFELKSDIYHMSISDGVGGNWRRHFLYAEKRANERKGDVGFGFHCGARDGTVFSNPEALPLDYDHLYFSWAYITVVPWQFYSKTKWGEDPNRSPDNWNWGTVDAKILGRRIMGCVNETPQASWQRLRKIGSEWHQFGDLVGGEPNYDKLKEFITEIAKRYGKNLMALEVGNEPNAGTLRNHPEIYAKCATAEAEALHAICPSVPVFYISGTGTFFPYLLKVNEAGVRGVNGLSLHTYTTPKQPEDTGLREQILNSRRETARVGADRYVNTETGVACIGRDVPEIPLLPEYVKEQAAKRAPGFFTGGGWPGEMLDEWASARSMTKNAVINLASGAEFFTYFGWNHAWIVDRWREKEQVWTMITGTPSGERSPTLFALAIGVQIEQMQGVLRKDAQYIENFAVYGGKFRKRNGGSLLFLWANKQKADLQILTEDPELETVSLFGKKTFLKPAGKQNGLFAYPVSIDENPVYFHSASAVLSPVPPAIASVQVKQTGAFTGTLDFMLRNPAEYPDGKMEISVPDTCAVLLGERSKSVEVSSGKTSSVSFRYDVENGPDRVIPFQIRTPSGARFAYRYELKTKPMMTAGKTSAVTDPGNLSVLAEGTPALLEKNAQCVVGAMDELASLKDPTKWQGPDELSAKIFSAYNDKYFFLYGVVRAQEVRVPKEWPGVWGSCVELFFDFRTPGEGQGKTAYGPNVFQFLLSPHAGDGTATRLHCIQRGTLDGSGIVANSGAAPGGKGYWFSFAVPWSFAGKTAPMKLFRFDVCVNGTESGRTARKVQMALFGTKYNCADASCFGIVQTCNQQ